MYVSSISVNIYSNYMLNDQPYHMHYVGSMIEIAWLGSEAKNIFDFEEKLD